MGCLHLLCNPQVNGCPAVGPKEIPSSINAGSSPLAFLSLFWDDALWEVLVNETNRQAFYVATDKPNSYIAKSWTDTTVQEMKAIFGCRTAIEMLIHKDRYEQYWRCKDNLLTNTPGFQKVFTRDRFLAIWSMLHCVDEKNPTVDKSDKIYKTRPVFNYILERIQKHYVPDQQLSLDEGMIPTKNSLSIKQYIKDKPIRWGLKTFLLTDSEHGYIVNAEETQGKNYIVYTDRFYTSVHLCEYLLTKGIGACGTAMTNRRSFPKCLQRKPRQMSKGDSEMLFNGKVGAIVWMDKKPIHFVTSVFVDQPCTSVSRYDGAVHRKVPVSCPEAVKKYNQFMGGTDKNDQMTRLQRCRRHYKWPRRLMMKFFMWTTYNAYVIQGYYIPHAQALKTMTNKCIELHYEVGIDLSDEIPSLQKETTTSRTLELQLYRGEIDLLLHNIIEKIGNEMEKIFSNYLTEELNNPHIQTTEKFLFEKNFRELKSLFLSIDRVL